MLSDKCNPIMAKAMGLIFSLLDIASAQQVPFYKLQCVHYTHHKNFVLLCVLFIFVDSARCKFAVVHYMTSLWLC